MEKRKAGNEWEINLERGMEKRKAGNEWERKSRGWAWRKEGQDMSEKEI